MGVTRWTIDGRGPAPAAAAPSRCEPESSYDRASGTGRTAELKRLEEQADLAFSAELDQLLGAGMSSDGTILDLGCGPGAVTRRLRAALPDARVLGADSDATLLALVDPPTLLMSGTEVPLETGCVDDVLVRYVAQHLPPSSRAQVWSEARRVLRPGGRIHVVDVDDAEAGTVRPFVPALVGVYAKIAEDQAARGGDRAVIRRVPGELSDAGFTKVRSRTISISSLERPVADFEVHLGPERHRPLADAGVLNALDMALLTYGWGLVTASPEAFVRISIHLVQAVAPDCPPERGAIT